jgi:hypothetical protein
VPSPSDNHFSAPTPRLGRRFRHLLPLCAALPGWGCVTLGELQTADTVGAGRSRWNLHGKAQSSGGDDVAPEASVGYPYGVSDSVDVGLRLFTAGAEVSGKVMLSPRESRTLVSLAPSVGGRFLGFEDYRMARSGCSGSGRRCGAPGARSPRVCTTRTGWGPRWATRSGWGSG